MDNKILIETRTRLCIEGKFDFASIITLFGEKANAKKLFIAGRYIEDDDYTEISVAPFEVTDTSTADGSGHTFVEHALTFYGVIPAKDGKRRTRDNITNTLVMPAKRRVEKMVTICFYDLNPKEVGGTGVKFTFITDARCENPEKAIDECRRELGETLLDIVDGKTADNCDYAKELDALTAEIAKYIRSTAS